MRTVIITGYIILYLLSSCSTTGEVECLFVDIDPSRKTMDSIIFKDREVIFLDNENPESLIRSIYAIDIYEDIIYVYDKLSANLLAFSRDGTFLSKIGGKGGGPGEYIRMNAFCIDRENEEIIISTDTPNKIMFFSLSGKFITETDTDDSLSEIVKKGNKLYASLHSIKKSEFAIYEIEDHSVKSTKYCETKKRVFNTVYVMVPPGKMLLMSESDILFTRTFDKMTV